ncbi:MAG: CHAD domain-containing protein [Rhodobacteraceae bacterium]|jgi:CHAD domain-containing protein|nr:CHAD domain-containing protein [Paracoccaceae bacterium]
MTPPELTRELAAAEALRRVAGRALADFEAARRRILDSDEPEGPHQARVALRRLRSHLRAFRRIAAGRALAPVAARARALFRLLGPLRDADVLVHDVAAVDAATLTRLQAEAMRLRAEVRAQLAAAGAAEFAAEAARALQSTGWEGRRAGRPAAKAAARALGRARDRLLAHGRRLASMPDADRHEARKNLKTLRYLVDDWGVMWPARKVAPLRRRLRALQDALGVLNDLALAEARGQIDAATAAPRRATTMAAAEAEWRRLRQTRPFW